MSSAEDDAVNNGSLAECDICWSKGCKPCESGSIVPKLALLKVNSLSILTLSEQTI